MKRLEILFVFTLFFWSCQSVNAQFWSGSTISTFTADNVGIGAAPVTGTNAIKLRLFNNDVDVNRNFQSTMGGNYNGWQSNVDVYVKSTGAGTKYGVRSYVFNSNSGTKYAIHAHANSAYAFNNPNAGRNIAVYAQADALNITQDRAGLFIGETEVKSNFIVGGDQGKFMFSPSTSGDYLSLRANGAGTTDGGYQSNRELRFNDSGELIKYIAGANDNALIVRLGSTDNFLVKGDGRVFAREVEVTLTPFPDYVFDENYELMPLGELERYIENHHHLPNMPSAAEVESNGLGLGELSTKQMEKIEELTLYLIEMNKRIEQLENENEKLRKQLMH